MFWVWQGILGINPQGFPASTWEKDHSFVFSIFENLDYSISKTIQANPCEFIPGNKNQVIPGNLQKYASTNRNALQCKTLPAHFGNNMMVYCLLNLI